MGIFIAISVILVWALHLAWMLLYLDFSASNPWMYFHIFLQGWLYTGLFITGHDAMHGTISKNKNVNKVLGTIATFLFAGMSYKMLRKNHGLHHKDPATGNDPDFYVKSQNFFIWWSIFMWRYVTIIQLVIMAIVYNIFIHVFGLGELKVIIYWALPAILGTYQLFYFGVYWPHKEPHLDLMMPHRARTLKKNHIWAMISCYFFGYHWEHHEDQFVPWWKLYSTKTRKS
ncbi:MAG: fatty acid desaturase [Bacteroidales bacterium]|nr:fatty acid desaturase [Bacteroidales bacterium]